IVALTIPFSLLISFIFFFLFGYTINIISLSSLAIAIGMVVDNAIVVVDNVSRHRERGEGPREGTINGASEVGLAISASTFTTVVVFVPMMFIKGVVGIMFRQLAVIVTVTLLASLFTALTFSPTLCSKWLIDRPKKRRNLIYEAFYNFSKGIFDSLEKRYAGLLGWSLGHKKLTIFCATAIFIGSLFLIPLIGTEFVPEEDTGDLSIRAELPVGTRLEETDKVAKQIEDIVKSLPEKNTYYARSGSAPGMGAAMGRKTGSNIATVGAKLLKKSQRQLPIKKIGQDVRDKIQKIPGIAKLTVDTGDPFARIILGGGKSISIEIVGHSIERTSALAEKIKSIIEGIPGARDVTISRDIGAPELHIKVDRLKANSLGLSMSQISDSVRIFLYGKIASRYREAGDEYDIFVWLRGEDRADIQDIENLPIALPNTTKVKLSSVATIQHMQGPLEIERLNQERVVKVEANSHGRSMGDVVKDIKDKISQLDIPEDITINFAGEAEEQAKAFSDMFILLLLGMMLVYMVMASQFESLVDPFVIMFAVPYAFTGVVIGLFLTGMTISVISFLGFIMLVGIVVNNAIVLISYINILRKRGMPMIEAIKTGGADRLRPVLMTTITTVFGLLPLAISRGEGSETWQPLGVSILSGLLLSTIVTMIIVPTLYAVFEERIKRNSHS
ncbi:MAG: efflux RND transporter permease subunit, partial [Candidatus Omnitrophota bacterium]